MPISINIYTLWSNFADVSIDQNECIETNFHIWPVGTARFDIWHWFDENCDSGILGLMFGKGN